MKVDKVRVKPKTIGIAAVTLLTNTTFACQAPVRQNETARCDVIVPFGLHV